MHTFQSTDASRTMRETEVIALVPAAQHSKTPIPKGVGKREFRTTTADAERYTPTRRVTIGNDHTARQTMPAVPADARTGTFISCCCGRLR